MKDELGGDIMSEFAVLRSKLYSFRKIDGSEDKKCKGIKKCVVKKILSFNGYKKRDSKMGLLVQTTTFQPLLSCANTVDEN